ncbi:hypothetical protein F2Q69_00058663 [Brassica cretica]|uniref:Uncharacterized protein n=1 Tax=Brassica cretica TaxID=69181 RepID=A0A8S9RAH1_BRACR|nr:hypothetical protein F2Q69_00058663 [Brassica cretica]
MTRCTLGCTEVLTSFGTLRPYRNPSGARIETRSSLGTRNVLLFAGTVPLLPRQYYYQYLFGFRILPLGSWPLSSSCAVFYFCRKSMTCFEGAGVGSPYRKFSISRRMGGDPGTGPRKLHSGEPGFLLAGILGTGVPTSGDPEAGVLPGSTGVAHSQQTSLRQDIAPVIPRSQVPLSELWAFDDVLETMEPGALMFPEEELA